MKKNLNGYKAPDYYSSSHYVRTGNTIVLPTDADYYNRFPDSKTKIFAHHFHPPYLYLAMRQFMGDKSTATSPTIAASLAGNWELNYISGPRIAFAGLYPDKKPMLQLGDDGRFSGSTSCNRINGAFTTNGGAVNFPEAMAMTRMMCPGEGEQMFLSTLKKVNRYAITDGNTLTLLMGDIAVMRFTRN